MYARKRISTDFGWKGNKDKEKGHENSGASTADIYVGQCGADWARLRHQCDKEQFVVFYDAG